MLPVRLRDRLVLRERAAQRVPQAQRVLPLQWPAPQVQQVVLALPVPLVPQVFPVLRVLPERLGRVDQPDRRGLRLPLPDPRVPPAQTDLAAQLVPLELLARAGQRVPREPADQPDRPEPQVRWPDQRVRREHPVLQVRQAQEPLDQQVRRGLLAAAEHLAASLQL